MGKRRPRGLKTRDDLVVAALSVADEIGVEALTIRAVAERADLAPMSVYSRVDNKEHLLDLMYQEVALRLYADSGNATWQAEYAVLCQQIRRTLLQHPNWVPLLARPAPAMSVPLRDRLLDLMTHDGFSIEQAFGAINHAGLMCIGFALVELTFRDATGASALEKRYERLEQWTQEVENDGPDSLTRIAVARAGRFDLEAQFTQAIRICISGLEAQRGAPPGSAST